MHAEKELKSVQRYAKIRKNDLLKSGKGKCPALTVTITGFFAVCGKPAYGEKMSLAMACSGETPVLACPAHGGPCKGRGTPCYEI